MSNSRIPRRTFITRASLAAAGTLLTTRRLVAAGASPHPAQAFLPDHVASVELNRLATSAVDAAMRAGATYADVRLGERHYLELSANLAHPDMDVQMTSTFTYGVRALVNGAWAFDHGGVPSVDAMTASARNAVAIARGYAPFVVQRTTLAPASVATGQWATPIQQDPFAVPLREYGALTEAYRQVVLRVPQAQLFFGPQFHWTKETRVFASSEGALTTQMLHRVSPTLGVAVPSNLTGWVKLRFPSFTAAAGGYECIADPTRYENAFLAFTRDVVRYQQLPRRTLDVGRYPLVVDGSTLGLLFGSTIGSALELDRVLGEEAATSGGSYLGPPLDLLGTPIASPALTVTASRAAPAYTAVQWDDEGVAPHEYSVIHAGQLIDYHTSRWTAPALERWYARQGQPVQSHGCAVATDASDPLTVQAPHIEIMPHSTPASLETLCHEMRDGVLALGLGKCLSDQQFGSGSIHASQDGLDEGVLLKVEKGHVVGRIVGNGVEFSAKRFWKEQLMTVGDASTVQRADFEAGKGMPARTFLQTTNAPAALFKDVNVIAHARTS